MKNVVRPTINRLYKAIESKGLGVPGVLARRTKYDYLINQRVPSRVLPHPLFTPNYVVTTRRFLQGRISDWVAFVSLLARELNKSG